VGLRAAAKRDLPWLDIMVDDEKELQVTEDEHVVPSPHQFLPPFSS
jgi:hypothetical protein